MPSKTTRSTMTIGDFLLRRLREVGTPHLFGVAGDFNLEFLVQMEEDNEFTWVGNCNELNAAYAADGYARISGLSTLVVTNGVGALSAINGVAGAYSEYVPIVTVCGSLPLKALDRNLLMHHTSADTDYDAVLKAYTPFTVAQTRLTPQNAVAEIDRLILTAWQRKRPVYMELPSDIAYLDVEVPAEPLDLVMPPSDTERLSTCTDEIVTRLTRARSPAILVDIAADRYGVADELQELAGKLQVPIAAINTVKGVIDETCPYFLGLYVGAGSAPEVRKAVEDSDCLLAIGVRRVDTTSGGFSDALPTERIDARGDAVDIGPDNYQAVYLKELLRRVADSVSSREQPASPRTYSAVPASEVAVPSGPLEQNAYWDLVQGFVREGDVIIAEDGTSEAGGWGLHLPPGCTFVTQAVWGSIGYTVGSVLGTMLAAPDRRHLLLVGDGSFQLTAQEVSTMLRHDLKPIIFLINNGGYTIERTICGKDGKFNDIANWSYADLPKVLHPGTNARTFVVKTAAELQAALAVPHDGMIFIEAIMDKYDVPPAALASGHKMAEVDYGPRGPQHRPGIQL
ncbi:alpha-keto acid decarboxylase family protein [Pseudonocardia acidicola]|uniref:Alpha-keto-acid decarboxylase n=1 Tax=Pseudonocardia acidicola TaxID=2724939 RepID=A0ABX1SB02_9PSEU|nr:thiamine pyrophosphate-binding protein [Pseudonocardia acidicola]NMH98735.1 alpha-keto acid decarboxylase family protein [Pseudonocardia acidicola]